MRQSRSDADARTVYATVRALEIVEEAARRIPEDVRAMEPTVPWCAMAGMRDRMIHLYEQSDPQYLLLYRLPSEPAF